MLELALLYACSNTALERKLEILQTRQKMTIEIFNNRKYGLKDFSMGKDEIFAKKIKMANKILDRKGMSNSNVPENMCLIRL